MSTKMDQNKVRWQIDVDSDQAKKLQFLMDRCSLNTRKDFFDNAVTLFQWAVNQVGSGLEVASYDPDTGIVRPVLLVALQNVPNREREPFVSSGVVTVARGSLAGAPSGQNLKPTIKPRKVPRRLKSNAASQRAQNRLVAAQ